MCGNNALRFPNFVANACCNPCCETSVTAQRVDSASTNTCDCRICIVPCCGCCCHGCGNVGGVTNDNCPCGNVGGITNDNYPCGNVGGITNDNCGCNRCRRRR